MSGTLRRLFSKTLKQASGSGVEIDAEGRLCLPDGLDPDRVHRFIELCMARAYESPKSAMHDLFERVGVSPAAISALNEIMGDRGNLDWIAIGRRPLKLGATLPRFLEIPARFRSFLVDGLGLADPSGQTLEDAVVSARFRAAEELGCEPCWDEILSRPAAVSKLASSWRTRVV
jgi:hypothetical protein